MGDRWRLFVALGVEGLIEPLLAVAPPPGAGTRVEPADRLHLTLHFLGRLPLDPVAAALEQVRVRPVELVLDRLGTFGDGDRTVLWAGVRQVPELLDLHRDVGRALAPVGFVPEVRPWRPHITLARSTRERARRFRLQPPPVGAVTVTEVRLLSSHLDGAGPTYVVERTFRAPPRAPGHDR